jgi:hypothetical protein
VYWERGREIMNKQWGFAVEGFWEGWEISFHDTLEEAISEKNDYPFHGESWCIFETFDGNII